MFVWMKSLNFATCCSCLCRLVIFFFSGLIRVFYFAQSGLLGFNSQGLNGKICAVLRAANRLEQTPLSDSNPSLLLNSSIFTPAENGSNITPVAQQSSQNQQQVKQYIDFTVDDLELLSAVATAAASILQQVRNRYELKFQPDFSIFLAGSFKFKFKTFESFCSTHSCRRVCTTKPFVVGSKPRRFCESLN